MILSCDWKNHTTCDQKHRHLRQAIVLYDQLLQHSNPRSWQKYIKRYHLIFAEILAKIWLQMIYNKLTIYLLSKWEGQSAHPYDFHYWDVIELELGCFWDRNQAFRLLVDPLNLRQVFNGGAAHYPLTSKLT